ncbi:MAG: hypothetical protein R2788_14265 [Saprospiraceae bacterium]
MKNSKSDENRLARHNYRLKEKAAQKMTATLKKIIKEERNGKRHGWRQEKATANVNVSPSTSSGESSSNCPQASGRAACFALACPTRGHYQLFWSATAPDYQIRGNSKQRHRHSQL